jgi:transposase
MSEQTKESEVETIHGFDIPKRQLTEEEATREITLERFQQFGYDAGEDFVDQCESLYNAHIFIGWCLHKYPELSKELLKAANSKYCSVQNVLHLLDNDDQFYTDFAEFLNQTEHAKAKTNQILIQVNEYYNK